MDMEEVTRNGHWLRYYLWCSLEDGAPFAKMNFVFCFWTQAITKRVGDLTPPPLPKRELQNFKNALPFDMGVPFIIPKLLNVAPPPPTFWVTTHLRAVC